MDTDQIIKHILFADIATTDLDNIATAIVFARQKITKQNKHKFVVGSMCKFKSSKDNRVVEVRVTKMGRKFAEVTEERGAYLPKLWRVPLSMLYTD